MKFQKISSSSAWISNHSQQFFKINYVDSKIFAFIDMIANEYKEYEMITMTLVSMAKSASLIKTNSVQRTRHMYAIRWRGSMFYMSSCIYKCL